MKLLLHIIWYRYLPELTLTICALAVLISITAILIRILTRT